MTTFVMKNTCTDTDLFLVVHSPGDDGASVKVDGARRVIASVEDDHGCGGHGRGCEAAVEVAIQRVLSEQVAAVALKMILRRRHNFLRRRGMSERKSRSRYEKIKDLADFLFHRVKMPKNSNFHRLILFLLYKAKLLNI